jgi:hypothetical protein
MHSLALPPYQLSLLLLLDLHYLVRYGMVGFTLGLSNSLFALSQNPGLFCLLSLQVHQINVVHNFLNVITAETEAMTLVELHHEINDIFGCPHGLLPFGEITLAVSSALFIQGSQK